MHYYSAPSLLIVTPNDLKENTVQPNHSTKKQLQLEMSKSINLNTDSKITKKAAPITPQQSFTLRKHAALKQFTPWKAQWRKMYMAIKEYEAQSKRKGPAANSSSHSPRR